MGSRPASPFSFSHVDIGDAFQFINHIMAERGRNTAGRSGVGDKALAFKPTGRGFAPRQSLSFSHVDVGDAFQFINHIMAERGRNTAGRSGVGDKALAFKPTGRGFAPRQSLSFSHVDVGDAFQFMNHIMAERYTCENKSARRWQEANPMSLVFNSSALSLPTPHSTTRAGQTPLWCVASAHEL